MSRMPSDIEYLQNYKKDTLYTNPGSQGTYVTIVAENEELVGEIEVTERSRIAVKAFYVNGKSDFSSFTITKLKFHKSRGWLEDGSMTINRFDLSNMEAFVSLISSLDLSDGKKAKIKLDGNVKIDQLTALLNSSGGSDLVQKLSESSALKTDIYAVASKRAALDQFKVKMNSSTTEPEWQAFFEGNSWIFGHGLNYVFLNKISKKLESTTTGASYNQSGNRADGLMKTRAEVSQYVLVEIKRSDTALLKQSSYRSGCWGVSNELSDAVTQIQKTSFDFSRNKFREPLKDINGKNTGENVYSVQPRSYLVIGNSSELMGHEDKIACFELYRRNTTAPEIITFDELFYRASCIVENLS